MRPFTYEVRRTLTSKFVILLIVAIIGLSSLLAYEAAITYNTSPVASRTPSVNYGYYLSGSNVTVVMYAYDPYGQPYSGLNINYFDQGNVYGKTSDSLGFANITLPYVPGNTVLSYNYSYTVFGTSFNAPKTPISVSSLIPYTGYSIVPGILNSGNTSNLGFQIMYVGPNGSLSAPVSAYVGTFFTGETSNEIVANSTYHQNVSDFAVTTIFPTTPGDLLNRTFGLALQGTGGIFLHPTGSFAYFLGRLSLYTPLTQKALQNLVLGGIGTTLGLLVPILGIFSAYLTYGKDRATGVLESVMKRPVTRHGLITSRFMANSVSIGVAVLVSMAIGDVIIQHYFGMYLNLFFSLFFIWTYVVEGLAFLALMYMFSHMVRTQGALLGVAITLFIVMDIFWLIIPAAVLAGLGISSVSTTYIYGNVAFGYASPAGYGGLVQFFFTEHIGFLSTATVNPAAFGVTQPWLILAGILWITVPFAVAYYLAGRYD